MSSVPVSQNPVSPSEVPPGLLRTSTCKVSTVVFVLLLAVAIFCHAYGVVDTPEGIVLAYAPAMVVMFFIIGNACIHVRRYKRAVAEQNERIRQANAEREAILGKKSIKVTYWNVTADTDSSTNRLTRVPQEVLESDIVLLQGTDKLSLRDAERDQYLPGFFYANPTGNPGGHSCCLLRTKMGERFKVERYGNINPYAEMLVMHDNTTNSRIVALSCDFSQVPSRTANEVMEFWSSHADMLENSSMTIFGHNEFQSQSYKTSFERISDHIRVFTKQIVSFPPDNLTHFNPRTRDYPLASAT